MNLQWGNIPLTLLSPFANITFNDDTNPVGLFLLDDSKCSISVALRVTKDDIPQGSGAIFHRPRLQSETLMTLGVEFYKDRHTPACDHQLVQMSDLLLGALNSLLDADQGRVEWTPSGFGTRLLDDALWAVAAVPFIEGTSIRGYTFGLDSPFPYAIDLAQTVVTVAAGATVTLTNAGSAPFLPVVKVSPASSVPLTAFTLTNHTVLDVDGNPLMVVYDSTRPGAQTIAPGHYAEIDFFRNTIYLDGASTNLKPGLDVSTLDFFPINPGANSVTVTGGNADFLLNNAWAG